MRVDFSAQYMKAEDLKQLAEGTLNASVPEGFAPAAGSAAFQLSGAPTLDEAGASHFNLQIGRRLVHDMDLLHANALVRGRSPQAAAKVLQASLALTSAPQIKLTPDWWPWLPLVPFRITVVSGQ